MLPSKRKLSHQSWRHKNQNDQLGYLSQSNVDYSSKIRDRRFKNKQFWKELKKNYSKPSSFKSSRKSSPQKKPQRRLNFKLLKRPFFSTRQNPQIPSKNSRGVVETIKPYKFYKKRTNVRKSLQSSGGRPRSYKTSSAHQSGKNLKNLRLGKKRREKASHKSLFKKKSYGMRKSLEYSPRKKSSFGSRGGQTKLLSSSGKLAYSTRFPAKNNNSEKGHLYYTSNSPIQLNRPYPQNSSSSKPQSMVTSKVFGWRHKSEQYIPEEDEEEFDLSSPRMNKLKLNLNNFSSKQKAQWSKQQYTSEVARGSNDLGNSGWNYTSSQKSIPLEAIDSKIKELNKIDKDIAQLEKRLRRSADLKKNCFRESYNDSTTSFGRIRQELYSSNPNPEKKRSKITNPSLKKIFEKYRQGSSPEREEDDQRVFGYTRDRYGAADEDQLVRFSKEVRKRIEASSKFSQRFGRASAPQKSKISPFKIKEPILFGGGKKDSRAESRSKKTRTNTNTSGFLIESNNLSISHIKKIRDPQEYSFIESPIPFVEKKLHITLNESGSPSDIISSREYNSKYRKEREGVQPVEPYDEDDSSKREEEEPEDRDYQLILGSASETSRSIVEGDGENDQDDSERGEPAAMDLNVDIMIPSPNSELSSERENNVNLELGIEAINDLRAWDHEEDMDGAPEAPRVSSRRSRERVSYEERLEKIETNSFNFGDEKIAQLNERENEKRVSPESHFTEDYSGDLIDQPNVGGSQEVMIPRQQKRKISLNCEEDELKTIIELTDITGRRLSGRPGDEQPSDRLNPNVSFHKDEKDELNTTPEGHSDLRKKRIFPSENNRKKKKKLTPSVTIDLRNEPNVPDESDLRPQIEAFDNYLSQNTENQLSFNKESIFGPEFFQKLKQGLLRVSSAQREDIYQRIMQVKKEASSAYSTSQFSSNFLVKSSQHNDSPFMIEKDSRNELWIRSSKHSNPPSRISHRKDNSEKLSLLRWRDAASSSNKKEEASSVLKERRGFDLGVSLGYPVDQEEQQENPEQELYYISRMLKTLKLKMNELQESSNEGRGFIYDFEEDDFTQTSRQEEKSNPSEEKTVGRYFSHFHHCLQSVAYISTLEILSEDDFIEKKVYLPPKKNKKLKTLVLDLDETLVHCSENLEKSYDVLTSIKFTGGEMVKCGVRIRPYAIEFLKLMSQFYEVVIFTASHSCYANTILNLLDPENRYITFRMFRESCIETEEGIFIKDLRVFANRDLKDLIIVDNACYSYAFQITNGIPIIPFFHDKDDDELLHLACLLKQLSLSNRKGGAGQRLNFRKSSLSKLDRDLENFDQEVERMRRGYQRLFRPEYFMILNLPDLVSFYFNGDVYKKYIEEMGEEAGLTIAKRFISYYQENFVG